MIWKSRWYPRLVFLASLIPLAFYIWKWQHHELGINAAEFSERYLGRTTLRFLLLTLAITPLRRIPGLGGLMRIRRMLGLFTFFYGCLHALYYFGVDAQWNGQVIADDLTIRRFFVFGMIALSLMAPLAATSFDRAVRWMGGRNWQRLHRLVYVSGIAGILRRRTRIVATGASRVRGP
jgi:sulfoxide reductase heme-binding subunit YedZ